MVERWSRYYASNHGKWCLSNENHVEAAGSTLTT